MNPPTKPIERVHICFSGDPLVGIPSANFTAEVFIDPTCVDDVAGWLEEIRADFGRAYACIEGEAPAVWFDFEIEQMGEQG